MLACTLAARLVLLMSVPISQPDIGKSEPLEDETRQRSTPGSDLNPGVRPKQSTLELQLYNGSYSDATTGSWLRCLRDRGMHGDGFVSRVRCATRG